MKIIRENLNEARNPENDEINQLIRDVLHGKSKAYSKLKKLGFDVKINSEGRKRWGREHFGDIITITNPENGRTIYASSGQKWKNDTIISHRNNGQPGIYLSGDRTNAIEGDENEFDFYTFLKSERKKETIDDRTDVQKFKDAKAFLKDNEYKAQQIDKNRQVLADIKNKYSMNEDTEQVAALPKNEFFELRPIQGRDIYGVRWTGYAVESKGLADDLVVSIELSSKWGTHNDNVPKDSIIEEIYEYSYIKYGLPGARVNIEDFIMVLKAALDFEKQVDEYLGIPSHSRG